MPVSNLNPLQDSNNEPGCGAGGQPRPVSDTMLRFINNMPAPAP